MMRKGPAYPTAQDLAGRAKIEAGVVHERGVLTEGYLRKGGLMGKPSVAQRPAPPPAFRPAQQAPQVPAPVPKSAKEQP